MNKLPTHKEILDAVRVIGSYHKSGRLPLPLFSAVAKVVVMSPVDLVLFTHHEGLKVIVAQRSSTDSYWPSNWHIPGKIMTRGDRSLSDTLKRIIDDELQSILIHKGPYYMGSYLKHVRRGVEHGEAYWAICEYDSVRPILSHDFKIADPADLPKPFMDHQEELVERATKEIKNFLRNS
jgi:hypothetical protein